MKSFCMTRCRLSPRLSDDDREPRAGSDQPISGLFLLDRGGGLQRCSVGLPYLPVPSVGINNALESRYRLSSLQRHAAVRLHCRLYFGDNAASAQLLPGSTATGI